MFSIRLSAQRIKHILGRGFRVAWIRRCALPALTLSGPVRQLGGMDRFMDEFQLGSKSGPYWPCLDRSEQQATSRGDASTPSLDDFRALL